MAHFSRQKSLFLLVSYLFHDGQVAVYSFDICTGLESDHLYVERFHRLPVDEHPEVFVDQSGHCLMMQLCPAGDFPYPEPSLFGIFQALDYLGDVADSVFPNENAPPVSIFQSNIRRSLI